MPSASPAAARAGKLLPTVTLTRAVLPLSSMRTPRRSAYGGAPVPWSFGPSSRAATRWYGAVGLDRTVLPPLVAGADAAGPLPPGAAEAGPSLAPAVAARVGDPVGAAGTA